MVVADVLAVVVVTDAAEMLTASAVSPHPTHALLLQKL